MIEALMIAAILNAAVLGAETVEKMSDRTVFAWDWEGRNADGTVCDDLDHFDLALFMPDGLTVVSMASVPPCQTTGPMTCENPFPWADIAGSVYQVKVRAVDDAGNASDWCPTVVTLEYDKTPPPSPAGLRTRTVTETSKTTTTETTRTIVEEFGT